MKKIIIFILIFLSGAYAQNSKIAVIINPAINSSSAALDSMLVRIDSAQNINAVVILGNLTAAGKADQFQLLKSSFENFSKPYFLSPGEADAQADARTWSDYLNDYGDENYFSEIDGIIVAGLNPYIPLTRYRHFSVGDLDWLETEMGKINAGKEIYLFSPGIFEKETDNWKTLFNHLLSKNLKMIVSGSALKDDFRNSNGIYAADLRTTFSQKNGGDFYYTIGISTDSIVISSVNLNGETKILNVINKSVAIEKSPQPVSEMNLDAVNVKMKTSLNSSLFIPPIFWNDKIYTAEKSGLISCIDTTGEILWDYDTYSEIYHKPVIADRLLAAATANGDIVTISAVTGEQIQSIGFDEIITTDLSVFEFEGTAELMMPKLTKSKAAILFGTADEKLYCYDFETLQKLWINSNAKGMITGSPLQISNKILFTSRDGFLYCIDARTGLLIWKWRSGPDSNLYESNILCDGKEVYLVSNGALYAVDLMLGKTEWSNAKNNFCGAISFAGDNSMIAAYSDKNKFMLLSADKGAEKKSAPFECMTTSNFAPAVFPEMYFLNTGGYIYTVNPKYKISEVMFLGDAPVHQVSAIGINRYLVSNFDGQILSFSLK